VAVSKRLAPVTLAVVALALTLTGVIYAATDANPSATPKDPLALNGYPPKTAELALKVTTGGAYSLSGTVDVDFAKDSVQAQLLVPLVFSATAFNLRLVDHHLYIGSSNLSKIFGAPWLATSLKQPSLFGLSLELTKPDISLISGFDHHTVTKNGYLTTYSYQRNNFVLGTISASPIKMPARTDLDVSITVGSQRELTSISVSEKSKRSSLTISLDVLSYNAPLHISAPAAKDVKEENLTFLTKLLDKTPLKGLLSPGGLSNLGKTQLS
jgi:hypothetical protein